MRTCVHTCILGLCVYFNPSSHVKHSLAVQYMHLCPFFRQDDQLNKLTGTGQTDGIIRPDGFLLAMTFLFHGREDPVFYS